MYCTGCGKQLPNGSIFCSGCGKRLFNRNASQNAELKMPSSEGLKNVTNDALEGNKPTTVVNAISPAEEIKKMKELFDMGIITQEEFDAKKKELLGF